MVHTIASFLHMAAAGFENQVVRGNLAPVLGRQDHHKDQPVENLAHLHHSHCCHRHPLGHQPRSSRRQDMEEVLDLVEGKGHCHSHHLALHG